MKKNLLLIGFILMVIAQLYVPAQMIYSMEKVLLEGEYFMFKTAPVDPNDPFRGKYIDLRFEQNSLHVPHASTWVSGDRVYVSLGTDTSGFATITSMDKTAPVEYESFVEATIEYIITDSLSMVFVRYPFNRLYMKESKAAEAERLFRESSQDSLLVTYASVRIKNGRAALENVYINNIPIGEYVDQQKTNAQ